MPSAPGRTGGGQVHLPAPALNLSGRSTELPVVRSTRIPRHACALTALVIAAVLLGASPAAADTAVTPATAWHGAGVNLTFTVTNEHPSAAITKVRLVLPTASPVAEVYALSVPDWAPLLTDRELNPPLQGIHGEAPLTRTVATILWSAVPGKAIPPGGKADLKVAVGPMPVTDQLRFALEPTYDDASTAPALPPVTLALTPAPAPASEQDTTPAEDVIVVETDSGMGFWGAAGWVAALLLAVAGGVFVLRTRRISAARTATADEGPTAASEHSQHTCADDAAASDRDEAAVDRSADPAETAHRARVTAWSYRDRP